ncbi:MAG: hypothetical protein IPO83_03255 [Chitinophagaceae bacterium]|nr:hypothetical protein [Chitinophagaceae bacterium]
MKKKNSSYLLILLVLLYFFGCSNPIELHLDMRNYCITDKNGGILRQVVISKIDSLGGLNCERIIIKSPNEKGSPNICLFEQNDGYNSVEVCTLEPGFIYKISARNQGFEDTLVFKLH